MPSPNNFFFYGGESGVLVCSQHSICSVLYSVSVRRSEFRSRPRRPFPLAYTVGHAATFAVNAALVTSSTAREPFSCTRPHERGVQPGRRPGAHKSLGGPWASKLKKWNGQLYAQSFYYYSFIYTVLGKLIDWSCFFQSYTMYRHFFWCAFGKISIAIVALLAQCTKYSVTCRNSRKYTSWRHIRFYPTQ